MKNAAVRINAPARSSLESGARSWNSGVVVATRTSPSSATGIAPQKVDCHPSSSSRTARMSTASPLAAQLTDCLMLSARGRSAGENCSASTDRAQVKIAVPPMPCRTLATINCSGVSAKPPTMDPTIRTRLPARTMRRLPRRSPRRPKNAAMPATSEKLFTAQAIASVEPPTARPIAGIAITKPSHTTHTSPSSRQTAPSECQRRGFSRLS